MSKAITQLRTELSNPGRVCCNSLKLGKQKSCEICSGILITEPPERTVQIDSTETGGGGNAIISGTGQFKALDAGIAVWKDTGHIKIYSNFVFFLE